MESSTHSKGQHQTKLVEMDFPSHFPPLLYYLKPKAKSNYFVFMDQAYIMFDVDEINS